MKLLSVVLLILAAIGSVLFYRVMVSNDQILDCELSVVTLEQLIDLPEEEIDYAAASLMISKHIFPDLDVAHYCQEIRTISETLRHRLNEADNAEEIATILVTELFEIQGFNFSFEREYHFMHDLLDHKLGDCYAWTCFYLAVFEQMGIKASAVVIPNHSFVRLYDTYDNYVNLDSWMIALDDYYFKRFRIPPARGSGYYMRDLSKKEAIANYIVQAASYLQLQRDDRGALNLGRYALRLDPSNPGVHIMMALSYLRTGQLERATLAAQSATQLSPNEEVVHLTHADIHLENGDLQAAEAALERVIAIDSTNLVAIYMLGGVYQAQNKNEQALEMFQRVAESDVELPGPKISTWSYLVTREDVERIVQKAELKVKALSAGASPNEQVHWEDPSEAP